MSNDNRIVDAFEHVEMIAPAEGCPIPVGMRGKATGMTKKGLEILWENGVVTYQPGSGEITQFRPPGKELCDFCSEPVGLRAWEYRCEDHQQAGIVMPTGVLATGSSGSWGACAECHKLIEAGQRHKLLARSANVFARSAGGSFREAMQAIGAIQSEFWRNKSDAPPIPPVPSDGQHR